MCKLVCMRKDIVLNGSTQKYLSAVLLQTRVKVYISYGGLLMLITGDLQKLQELEVDSNVYLLMRKV